MRTEHQTPVALSVDDGKIIINPHTEAEYRLEDLLRGVSKGNHHAEVRTGAAVGWEVW